MATKSGASEATPGTILLVVHDFLARSPDELTLAKGDRIELIERDDEFGDGWYLGRHLTNGNSGLFPEVYTTPAPKGTLTAIATNSRAIDTLPSPSAPPSTALPSIPSQPPASSPPASPTFARPVNNGAGISALPQTTLRASPPTTTATTGHRAFSGASDSPVMSETLSVIDEHITDMNTPRSSYNEAAALNGSANNARKRDSVSSSYSHYPPVRRSYIDEEEHPVPALPPQHQLPPQVPQVPQVQPQIAQTPKLQAPLRPQSYDLSTLESWPPAKVARYLEEHGVEPAHCAVFLEQDISGEVLLAMDQNSVFIKEFELGSVGRRLKTWHKIKALQDEVRRPARPVEPPSPLPSPPMSVASANTLTRVTSEPMSESSRTRSSSTISAPQYVPASGRPRPIPVKRSKSNTSSFSIWGAPTMTGGLNTASPLQSVTPAARPSAQSVRSLNQSRRHSSIDSTASDGRSVMGGHRKQVSISSTDQQNSSTYTNGKSPSHGHAVSVDSHNRGTPGGINAVSPNDTDRGYFSSTEAEGKLRKSFSRRGQASNSAAHGRSQSNAPSNRISMNSPRQPDIPETSEDNSSGILSKGLGALRIATFGGFKRSNDSPASGGPGTLSRNNSHTTSNATPETGELRGAEFSALPGSQDPTGMNYIRASARRTSETTASPTSPRGTTVSRQTSGATAMTSPRLPNLDELGTTIGMPYSSRAEAGGPRSVSDAVTQAERGKASGGNNTMMSGGLPMANDPLMSTPTTWTGSSGPSTEKDPDSARASTGSGGQMMVPPAVKQRPRVKNKKETSAYTRGLEKKTPAEQLETCDYSGWMKKKSGSLMSTWKTRLFILRGRRLSYYYSDDDTEEKGLIDISFHRVLPAHNETLTGLHATVTGAGGGSSGPLLSNTVTSAQLDLLDHPPAAGEEDEGLFIFKLVPPKAGLSKGVSFTKPTVHYFAVNSRQEGRLWMAALMKATIDRDEDATVTTTYNQKTISLAKARARKERPPALQEEEDLVDGLGILHESGTMSGYLTPIGGGNTVASSTFGGSEGDLITTGSQRLDVQPPTPATGRI